MKKLGLICREKIVEEIEQGFSNSTACLFLGVNNLTAFDFNMLRNDLHKSDTRILLSKNTLIKRAFQKLGREDVDTFLHDSTGVVFVQGEDIALTCKALVDFSKEKENAVVVRGGYIQERKLDENDITNLASLPPKNILLGMAVSAIASPLTGFLAALNQIPQKFVWALEEIKKKKSA